jgi:hypothetical protein
MTDVVNNITNQFYWPTIIMWMHKCSNELRIIIQAQYPFKVKQRYH